MTQAAVIWKTELSQAERQNVRLPFGAEILCAREQHGEVVIWYRCDPNAPRENRDIAICMTGQPAPAASDSRYLGTAFLNHGIVVHVFERTPVPA